MDPEQTFIRVQERFTQMLTPRIRASLEYFYLFLAITLFCILVVMHANYVQQPGCSSELTTVETAEAQLIHIKITSVGLWSHNESENNMMDAPGIGVETIQVSDVDEYRLNFLDVRFWLNWIISGAKRSKSALKMWKLDSEMFESQPDTSTSSEGLKPVDDDVNKVKKDESRSRFHLLTKETFRTAMVHISRKWYGRLSFFWRHAKRFLGVFWEFVTITTNFAFTVLKCLLRLFCVCGSRAATDIAGIHLNLDVPKWLRILHLDHLNSLAVQWLEKRSKAFEPTYLYTMEKGYFLLPEEAKLRHNIRTINISISARHSCFGNRWQQLLINRLVGYDTILMNSLLNSPGQGYLYNYQTREFYNLTHAHEQPEVSLRFGDYLATKCGVLIMSMFVFFTTTMSVSFTLRETQTRMLKFTVQLQHHARHQLPTFQLIFVHVIESLVFVPIMIGILFFLFEFYDDQLLAFMVLILVWLCELFTLISVRTPLSMKFFPRFFLLYFLVFHIYFFSYTYGFSYLALSTTAAFMQHLILYFWNRFEIPALQRFMLNRRSNFQHHPDFHITSSTILASTLHITRVNNRNHGPANLSSGPGPRGQPEPAVPENSTLVLPELHQHAENLNSDGLGHPPGTEGQTDLRQEENVANPGAMNSFSSMLLWLLGGVYFESFNSILSIFRDGRVQGQVYNDAPHEDNPTVQGIQ